MRQCKSTVSWICGLLKCGVPTTSFVREHYKHHCALKMCAFKMWEPNYITNATVPWICVLLKCDVPAPWSAACSACPLVWRAWRPWERVHSCHHNTKHTIATHHHETHTTRPDDEKSTAGWWIVVFLLLKTPLSQRSISTGVAIHLQHVVWGIFSPRDGIN